jgi:hypothetical protein
MQVAVREMLAPAAMLRLAAHISPSATVSERSSSGSGALCVVLCTRLWRDRSGQLPPARRVLLGTAALATLLAAPAALSELQLLMRERSGGPPLPVGLLPPGASSAASALLLSDGRLLSLLLLCAEPPPELPFCL